MSKQIKTKEIRKKFLLTIKDEIEKISQDTTLTDKEKMEQLIYSIFVITDGSTSVFPKFIIAPDPHPTDKEYNIQFGKDFYVENRNKGIQSDISGGLQDDWIETLQGKDINEGRFDNEDDSSYDVEYGHFGEDKFDRTTKFPK